VDNLGDPVIGARIVGGCYEFRPDGRYRRTRRLFTLTTGPDGMVNGTYKQPKAGCGKSIHLRMDKEGYATSDSDALGTLYVLKRKVQAADLDRVMQLSGANFDAALRNLLTSDLNEVFQVLAELVFYYEERLRPALRSLIEDPEAGIPARKLLSFIGAPEDLRLVAQLKLRPPKEQEPFEHRWLYDVTCSLLEPASEAEWSLLRESALGEYKDYWVTRGAIQSLKLIASQRSRQILEEVQRGNSFGAELTPSALEYIQSNPQPLRDRQLEELGHRVAQALGYRTWTGNGTPKYNQTGDKAIIPLHFDAGEDRYVFIGTFQRVDGAWVLRGVRETMQALVITGIGGKTK
jgi:hypothetical protein